MIQFKKIIPITLGILALCFTTTSMAIDYQWVNDYKDHKQHRKNFKVKCSKVKLLDAQLAMIPPIGPASGLASFVIGGKPMLATATVELLGPPQLQTDGTATILVQIQYDFGGGDVLQAFAKGILTQTDRLGVFENNAQINYIGGSGIYQKAYGRFDAEGFLNFDDFLVEMVGEGEICNRGRFKQSQ